jgi:hypothetical protein
MKRLLFVSVLFLSVFNVQGQIGRYAFSSAPVSSVTLYYGPAYTDNFNTYTANASLNGQGNWDVLLNDIYVYDGGSGARLVQSYTSASVTVAQYDATFGTDQYASISISLVGAASDAMGVAVRLSGTGATTCGYGYYAMNGTQRLFRIDNGVKTNLGSMGSAVLTAGDVIRLEVVGSTLTAYRNGVVDTGVGTNGSATVTEYTSGKAGISGYNNGTTLGDLFSAGDIYCSEYNTIYNTMTNKPPVAVGSNQNTLVKALKSAGTWALRDAYYVFAQYSNTANEGLINWKNPGTFNATIAGAPTFASLEGFTLDGTDDVIYTGMNLSTEMTYYTRNSANVSVYTRTNPSAGMYFLFGTSDNSNEVAFLPKTASTQVESEINDYTSAAIEGTATASGYWQLNRSGATAIQIYHNGVSFGTTSTASTGLPNSTDFAIGGFYYAGSLYYPIAAQMSAAGIGGSLTATQLADENTAIEAYMDSNSKGVE